MTFVAEVTTGWHLDKRVPVAIIVALLVQAGSFGWLFAKIDSRINAVEIVLSQRAPLAERFIQNEAAAKERWESIEHRLSGMERKMDQIHDALFPRRGP